MVEGDGLISKNQFRHDLCLSQMLGGFPVCPEAQSDQSKMIYSPGTLGNFPHQAHRKNMIGWLRSCGRSQLGSMSAWPLQEALFRGTELVLGLGLPCQR